MLHSFLISVQAFIKCLLCFLGRDIADGTVQVARRYAMNANLIHKWLRDPQFSSEDQAADLPVYEGATLLPVEVAGKSFWAPGSRDYFNPM